MLDMLTEWNKFVDPHQTSRVTEERNGITIYFFYIIVYIEIAMSIKGADLSQYYK